MAFNSFVRIASSSIMFQPIRSIRPARPYQRVFSVLDVENRSLGQFPTFLRFLTGPAVQTSDKFSINKAPLPKDGLDALPFDIKDGGPDEGYLTLIRKCPDEIIEVKVRPFYDSIYLHGRANSQDAMLDDREEVLKFFGVMEEVEDIDRTYDEDEEKEPTLMRNIGKRVKIGKRIRDPYISKNDDGYEVVDDRRIKYLYMIVKIYFGDEYRKWLKFFVRAYPNKLDVPIISTSVEGDAKHLEEYEEFLKHRGIEPSNIIALFNSFEKQIK